MLAILVLTNVLNLDDAKVMAQNLVFNKLCACVNIMPKCHSIYSWQGKVKEIEEYTLLIKSTKDKYPSLELAIKSLHKYKMPEIIAIDVAYGLSAYLDWINSVISVDDVPSALKIQKKELLSKSSNFTKIYSKSKNCYKLDLNNRIEIFEKLFNSLPYVFWKDRSGIYRGANANQAKGFGFDSPEKFIGKNIYEILTDLESAKLVDSTDNKIMEKGKTITLEETIQTPDGIKTFLSQKQPLYDDGVIVGLLGCSMDVTQLREQEKLVREENARHQIVAEQQANFRKIAAQVAHDIASPIFALQIILPHCDILPENTRNALNKFSTRIIDITQNFLSQFKQKEDGVTTNGVTRIQASIYTELTEIVTEKKYEYSNRPIKFVTEINPNSYFAFINVDIDTFKRMMSNIINNSVEALENQEGIILIYLDTIDDKVQIIIEDNGKGISLEVKNKILSNITITSGKINGYGIGFSQIRDTLNNNQGNFVIESKLKQGTKITLSFPKIEIPNWITDKIELKSGDLVVIVDDEPYVHEAWECQFKSFAPNIIRKHFEQGKEAIQFLNNLTNEDKKKILLLTDYELLKQNLTGLDIINKTNIEHTILVTSHHNDCEIREQSINLGIKILPKELAFATIINLCSTECCY